MKNKTDLMKSAVERQKYVTDLAVATFNYFTKTFIWISGGAFAALSLKEKLDIKQEVLISILSGMAVLITIVGLVSIFQISFGLVRWYKYRIMELELSDYEKLKPEWWAALYELSYVFTIVGALVIVWCGKAILVNLL